MSFLNNARLRSVLSSREGQMSLILILIVAVGLIFFAVTLNWAKISSMKTMTTVASNIGAAKLASSMGSYGESPVQSSLEGKRKKCSWSPFFAKLLVVGIIVAMLIASILCAGTCSGILALIPSVTTMIVATVAAVAALALQATVVEPGINTMWNKLNAQIQTIEGQFAESAIQTALQSSVSDQVRINDISDYDMDGKWCHGAAAADPNCPYKTSRFAYYYTKRVVGIPGASTKLLDLYQKFRAKLGEFVGDNLGVVKKAIVDPVKNTYVYQIDDTCCLENNKAVAAGASIPMVVEQYCNNCCITLPLREPVCGVGGAPVNEITLNDLLSGATPPVIPNTCPPGFFQCACPDGPYQSTFPLSYDPLFCLRFHYQRNNYMPPFGHAYAAVMGVDDSVQTITRLLDTKPNRPDLMPPADMTVDTSFRGKDSEGKFFPFLWYMTDTKTKIKDLFYATSGYDGCHWCKNTDTCKVDAVKQGLFWVSNDPLGSLNYDVGFWDPAVNAPTAPNDDLKCVNRFEGFVSHRLDPTEEFQPDRQIDNVEPFYKYVGEAIKEQHEGGSVSGCPGAPDANCTGCKCVEYQNDWRPGNDRYCSGDPTAPYFSGTFDPSTSTTASAMGQLCAKFQDPGAVQNCLASAPDKNEPEIQNYGGGSYNPSVCSCSTLPVGSSARTAWRDDQFDLVIDKMSFLANDTRMILMDSDDKYYKEVDQWGQKAKRWVADFKYVADSLDQFSRELTGWTKDGSYSSEPCYTSAWCLPTMTDVNADLANTFVGVSREELLLTGGVCMGPGCLAYGSLPSVMKCFDYNLQNQAYFNGLAGPYGAAMAAKNAYLACAYPVTLAGYKQTGCVNMGTPDQFCATDGVYYPGLLPLYPLEPMPLNGQCGLNCSRFGDVVKDMNPPNNACLYCGYDCWHPAGWGGTYCNGDPKDDGKTCQGCGGSCVPNVCSGAPSICRAPCGTCTAATCTGTCSTCPGTCSVWAPNICADLVTPCQPSPCPTYCQGTSGAFNGVKVQPPPAVSACYPGLVFGGPCPNQCSYTNDCSDKDVQWTTNKQNLANLFYQARHGTPSPVPPSPGYTATGGFMRELERNWHRTLSTKSLYIGVPPLPYDSGGIGGTFFSDQVSDIRGWDTQPLVGQIKDPTTGVNGGDDCETYYNFCRPLNAVISLPNCSKLLAMCISDPVFVQDFLPDSRLLAGRQAPKLTKRQQYLQFLIDKINDITGSLPPVGVGALSPLQQLANDVDARLNDLITENEAEKLNPPELPNWATYVWQSPPPKNSPPGTQGYWHAVKVEALLPKRCFMNGARDYDNFDCCAGDGKTYGENKDRFPWIRAYSAHWKTRRCFEMWDENGCVKVRVSRFDEDHSLQVGVIKFLNQLPMWQFLYRHPLRGGESVDNAIKTIGSMQCAYLDTNAAGAYMSSTMVDNPPLEPNGKACYEAAEELIHRGFISETCARYDLQPDPTNPDKWTYDLMFRDCKHCCLHLPQFHKLQDD